MSEPVEKGIEYFNKINTDGLESTVTAESHMFKVKIHYADVPNNCWQTQELVVNGRKNMKKVLDVLATQLGQLQYKLLKEDSGDE